MFTSEGRDVSGGRWHYCRIIWVFSNLNDHVSFTQPSSFGLILQWFQNICHPDFNLVTWLHLSTSTHLCSPSGFKSSSLLPQSPAPLSDGDEVYFLPTSSWHHRKLRGSKVTLVRLSFVISICSGRRCSHHGESHFFFSHLSEAGRQRRCEVSKLYDNEAFTAWLFK